VTRPSRISRIFLLLAGLGLVAAAACGSSSDTGGPADGGAADGSTLPGDDAATDDPHDPIAWASPESARDLDGQLARVTLDLGQSSEHLRITDFGFAIPASATIKGVEVEFKRQAGDTGIGDGKGDAGGAAIEARVESMRMTICYCE